jgi:threonine dehydratase
MNIIPTNNIGKKNNAQFVSKVLKNYEDFHNEWKNSNYFESHLNKNKIIFIDETIQDVGAFKIRGAITGINNILKKNPKITSIVCASSGSFGISVANVCKRKKINCIVFIPKNSSLIKKEKILSLNSIIDENNENYDDAKKNAKKYSNVNSNFFYIDGCREDIFWGNGSIVVELINKYSNLDKNFLKKKIAMILPVGVGSLASPSSILLKHFFNNSSIITVETLNFCKFYNNFNTSIKPTFKETIAEGVAVKKLPLLSYNILKKNVDFVSIIDETKIYEAMKYLFKNFKIVSEGAGALATALFINNKIFFKNYDYVFIPICGKNIEKKKFNKIILNS